MLRNMCGGGLENGTWMAIRGLQKLGEKQAGVGKMD
jgi:hypothetical protein